MKKEDLFDIIGEVDDAAVEAARISSDTAEGAFTVKSGGSAATAGASADNAADGHVPPAAGSASVSPAPRPRRFAWQRRHSFIAAIAACMALFIGIGLIFGRKAPLPSSNPCSVNMLVASAVYPYVPKYPDANLMTTDPDAFDKAVSEWIEKKQQAFKNSEPLRDSFGAFLAATAPVFLSENSGENKTFSPVSLYMALAMSAEVSDGDTRRQLLDLLHETDIDSLRTYAKNLWESNYMDDGMAKCILGTSLWMNAALRYKQDAADSLAANYYTDVYSGEPATEEYNQAMQDWMNAHTDNLLSDYVSDIKMDPATVFALVSTVNYAGKWNYPFLPKDTKAQAFHAPGGDVQCDFMNFERDMTYYWSDTFTSISLPLENNGEMRLILPDEGYTPEDLLQQENVLQYMSYMNNIIHKEGETRPVKSAYITVTGALPKFDISAQIDLKDGLAELGVTDIFDSTKADFSPMIDGEDGVFVSKAEQATRVMIDEEGCRASSLTTMLYAGAAIPSDHEYFILDRPFLFEIVSENGLPLFAGIVNNPAK